MIQLNKEYYTTPLYFYTKETKDTIDVYFSIQNTLTEARKKDEKISLPKNKKGEVVNTLSKLGKSNKKKLTIADVRKEINRIKTPKTGEMSELVGADGSLGDSSIPILNMPMHPRKTMDQTVKMTRVPKSPYSNLYRVYYGESEESEPTINEINMEDVFGYEETSGKTGPETYEYFKDEAEMSPKDAWERTLQQGKDPEGKEDESSEYSEDPNFVSKGTISEKRKIEEVQRKKMLKMLEVLLNKKNSDNDISKKEEQVSKTLKRNVSTLKKMAEKEGLSINELIKMLKGE
jgi:hypothetical protein